MTPRRARRFHLVVFPGLFAVLLLLVYSVSRTGFPPWGDGLEFAAVSSHLGVAHPPGYPLYTLLGWLLQWPAAGPYLGLLFINAAAAAAIGWCTFLILRRLLQGAGWTDCAAANPAITTALILALSAPVGAALFVAEVYLLHAALLLAVVMMLLEAGQRTGPDRHRLLAASGAVLGLALSHQLPALALLPLFAIVLWRLSIQENSSPVPKAAIALPVVLLILIPLLLYGTLPLRAGEHGIYWGGVHTPAGLLEHVRGGEYGQYRLLQERPGVTFRIDTWTPFAAARTVDIVRHFGSLVFGLGPTAILAGLASLGLLAFGTARALRAGMDKFFLAGLYTAIALKTAFVLVYNIRDIDDYYLPIFVLVGPLLGFGLLEALREADRRLLERHRGKLLAAVPAFLVLACLLRLTFQMGEHRIQRTMAEDWKDRVLAELPEGAALVTVGDADLYTMWYLQFARKEQTGVFVFGANFIRFPWFRTSLPPDDPRREAVAFHPGEPGTMDDFLGQVSTSVFEPLLEHGPVYTTMSSPPEIQWLSRRFEVREVEPLLGPREFEAMEALGLVNVPPPVLYEIRPLEGGSAAP